MTAVVLHLSDIHLKSSKDPILNRANNIASSTFSVLPQASHVFVVISGDIAYSGKEKQYSEILPFFQKIKEAICAETEIPVSFVVVPGNHDCDFTLNTQARSLIIEGLENSECKDVDDSILGICTSIQKNFFDFQRLLENNEDACGDQLWRTQSFFVEEKQIDFECLNVSWVSKLKEEPGKLFYPIDRYKDKNSKKSDVCLVVMHHPLNWFGQSIYRPFREFVRKKADLLITGHEHQANVGLVHDSESDKSAFVEGCVLQGEKDLSDSSFNIIVLDLEVSQFSSTRYKWNGEVYLPTEEGSWSDYHELPAKRASEFPINESFYELLEDPGAYLRHPSGSNISLTDIFVYPDLRVASKSSGRRQLFISSQRLLSPEITADGVLIEGEEKSGKTSLLYKLFKEYHDRGFVPLLVRGKDIRWQTDSEIDSAIRKAIKHQYGNMYVEKYLQFPSTQKLLLLDDFDESSMKASKARINILCGLRKRFGHMVLTTGEMFEVREVIGGDTSRQLTELRHYEVQPFGYALRLRLIERWFSLGADGTVDEADFIARCDQAERLMDAIMAKSIIPSHPLYLLTLLQSLEAGRSGDFKESALGYYYEYLLTEAFRYSGVKSELLTEMFQYSAHLAWEFHSRGNGELRLSELREFNNRFSADWVTVDLSRRLDLLLKARVIAKNGDDYKFRYPYIYYYLKGKYLSQNLSELEIRAYISHCSKHLYVRDHANTVLFLAHHTNDEFVINSISDALHGLFRGHEPVAFDGDTKNIERLIQDAPKLSYSGGSAIEYRRKKNEMQDEYDDGGDGLRDFEEDTSELSFVSQMVMLLKTTEILGQILKNQYSKIPRIKKINLLEELFNGPLRALRDFYCFLENNTDTLANEIEASLEKKCNVQDVYKRKVIARMVVANIIQMLTAGFVHRASQSANSESLAEDVRKLVEKSPTNAFRIIELGIMLDSAKQIPQSSLLSLYKRVEKDIVAAKLIETIVVNRLYMFKTTEKDMQRLSSNLKIDMRAQHAITYQEKSSKRLK